MVEKRRTADSMLRQLAIGEVFVSSVYDVPCMYVRMFVIRDGMLADSYVCTYGALLLSLIHI